MIHFPASTICRSLSTTEFEQVALDLFRYQVQHCEIYKAFVSLLGINLQAVTRLCDIPFLPIEFFKSHQVLANGGNTDLVFGSSGTTGSSQSKHFVHEPALYTQSFSQGFRYFYGQANKYCILALLPGYLERTDSSLVAMVQALITQSKNASSRFVLYEHEVLLAQLLANKQAGQKTILIGVTYALLDFIEKYSLSFPALIVMETGGMKGKRAELIREDLHQRLNKGFGTKVIHSEYGMTELLSQAYSKGNGIFSCPPWMKICIRDPYDPLRLISSSRTGGVNVIDLANVYSCAFIATQDLGRAYADGSFEIMGRFDQSDIRGCNLLLD